MIPEYPHYADPRFPWRNATLYSIAGWMSSWYGWENVECATAFGGYFRLDVAENHIEGEIVDTWGMAKMEGQLQPESLNFDKVYADLSRGAKGAIKYKFSQDNGVWRGEFTLDSGIKGKAECKIYPVVENAFYLMIGPPRR